MGFKSNGKPGHIYHWNLPVLKKMLTKGGVSGGNGGSAFGGESTGRKSSNLRHSNDVNDLIDIQHIPTWSNPWDDTNDNTFDKAFAGKHNRGVNGIGISGKASAGATGINALNFNGIDDDLNLKLLKKKSPTYYAPTKQKKKATMVDNGGVAAIAATSSSSSASSSNKYFPGNGKPKSFYVIKKNAHKPYYQKLIS